MTHRVDPLLVTVSGPHRLLRPGFVGGGVSRSNPFAHRLSSMRPKQYRAMPSRDTSAACIVRGCHAKRIEYRQNTAQLRRYRGAL
jgi:hypothetical protein